MYIHTYIYIYICLYIYRGRALPPSLSVCLSVCLSVSLYIYTHIHTYSQRARARARERERIYCSDDRLLTRSTSDSASCSTALEGNASEGHAVGSRGHAVCSSSLSYDRLPTQSRSSASSSKALEGHAGYVCNAAVKQQYVSSQAAVKQQ